MFFAETGMVNPVLLTYSRCVKQELVPLFRTVVGSVNETEMKYLRWENGWEYCYC